MTQEEINKILADAILELEDKSGLILPREMQNKLTEILDYAPVFKNNDGN